jgi:hypothetical protein
VYENRTMKLVANVLRRREVDWRRMMEDVNLIKIHM